MLCDCSAGFDRRESIILAIEFCHIVKDYECLSMQETYETCFSIFKLEG